ncbi:MAG: M28 family peptidase [Proteobacteria bacterium]|nr:M28 family peptidase [Pseudomonadota bacterium]
MLKQIAGLCGLLLCAAGALATEAPAFDEAQIRATIRTLASDEFDGRAPASLGEQRTINYLAAQFRHYGLAPANHGSYLQSVPMIQITASPDTELRISGGAAPLRFAYGDDVVVTTPRPQATVTLRDSPLVFAGYGIVAPEFHWNDYAGVDVRGKTVIVLVNDPGYASNDPPLFHGKAMTYYGRWTYKYEEATRQGAAAVLIVHDTGPAGYPWEVVRNSWSGPAEVLVPGKGHMLQINGWLSHEAASRLLAAAGQDLQSLSASALRHGFRAVALPLKASMTLRNSVRAVVSHNVAALVPGARHPEQVVVYSAHWDHFGEKPDAAGHAQIFHGAIDNGSGIACLLQLARRFAAQKPAPARSILFLATTAEEQGLLGSAYYVQHPLIPLANTVADINMDVMDVYGPMRDLTVRGQFMSTLDDDLRRVVDSLGLELKPDPDPSKGYYYRADHFEFAQQGVPALSINPGSDYVGHEAGWGLAQQHAYNEQRYHKSADVYETDWNLGGMLQQLQAVYLTGRTLADSEEWPEWYPDNAFKAKRTAQRARQGAADR